MMNQARNELRVGYALSSEEHTAGDLVRNASLAEAAGFDSVFAVEHVVFPDNYTSVYPYAPGGRLPGGPLVNFPDPLIWLTWVAAATTRLRFMTAVMILPQRNPLVLAKEVATLDYLSGGRIGWNIVTGHLRGEHRALGLDQLDHDARYDRADEYMDVCRALWSGVHDGALQADRQSGIFADPAKVDVVQHQGSYFRCHTVPPALPSRQGHPVLFQAGSSGRGQRFALKNADVVFAIQPHMSGMKTFMQQLQAAARDAQAIVPKVTFGVQPIIGGTEAEAKRRLEELIERIPLEAALARLSGSLGVDFSQMELDQALEEQQTQASQGLMKAMSASFDNKRFTLREAAVRWGLAVGMPQLVGTPEQVADQLEAIWRETGCHGFNVTPTITPSSVEEFVDEVVPILQRRGIFRTAYAGETFRDNLLN